MVKKFHEFNRSYHSSLNKLENRVGQAGCKNQQQPATSRNGRRNGCLFHIGNVKSPSLPKLVSNSPLPRFKIFHRLELCLTSVSLCFQLKAFYVDLLVPLETNLEKDTKVVQVSCSSPRPVSWWDDTSDFLSFFLFFWIIQYNIRRFRIERAEEVSAAAQDQVRNL